MSAVSTTTPAFDLGGCAREPIHIPGGIQPHGVLMVLEPESLRVLQLSANAAAWLGSPIEVERPQPFASIGGAKLAEDLRQWIATPDPVFLRTTSLEGRAVQILGHRTAQGIVLELEEPPRSERETLEALYPRLGRYIEELQACGDARGLCELAARQFREITRFDRVLIYRFDADWNGEVAAEDGNQVLPSYLGLRFPASDIPAQARELYRRNRLRLIPNADYVPVPIEPPVSPIDHAPLDLSQAALRSVSPVHLQYMRNMGTLASMSISILMESRLWGLVSCHNAQPRQVNAQLRTACDLLGKIVSLQLTACEQGLYAKRRIELKRLEVDLLARLAASSFPSGLVENAGPWLELCGAGGAVVLTDSQLFTAGQTPPAERLRKLAEVIRARHGEEVFVADALGLLWPEFADIAPQASGVLAIAISQLYPSYMMWFRPEAVRTVRWGGDPRKPLDAASGALNPRNSFEVWKEQVRLRAEPWTRAEVDSIAELRSAIINLVLLRAEERAALTSQLERSNRELESFSYSVSHDLRAPFRHIVGYTQLLKDHQSGLSEKSLHYLDSINEAAVTAGKLVDDLLSFSHLGRTSLLMHRVDMNKLVEEVLRSLAPDISGRDIVWHIAQLPDAFGDASLLRQVLSNLIDNAMKYSRARTPAVIEIDGKVSDGECVYRVKDNGVGFDMAYVGKLFGVFQRLHRIEDFEGTGIGLALSKRIIERHGGWVRAEGTPGAGACFWFAIPSANRQSSVEATHA